MQPPQGGCKAIQVLTIYFYFMIALILTSMFAAAGYSLVYLLAGGGLFGALMIFIIAKMLGR